MDTTRGNRPLGLESCMLIVVAMGAWVVSGYGSEGNWLRRRGHIITKSGELGRVYQIGIVASCVESGQAEHVRYPNRMEMYVQWSVAAATFMSLPILPLCKRLVCDLLRLVDLSDIAGGL